MNKWLLDVIAEGIMHTWGSADMKCYQKDKEAMVARLRHQYEMSINEANAVANRIIKKGEF